MDRRPNRIARLLIVCCALVTAPLIGCIDDAKDLLGGDDDGKAAEGYESLAMSRTEASLLLSALDAARASGATTEEELAAAVEADAATAFTPSGCVQTTRSGNVVGYDFDNCDGPYGLVDLSGTAAVAVTLSGTDIEANLTATGLQAGSGTLTINADGTVTGGPDNPSLTVTTVGGGTAPGGTVIARQGTFQVDQDQAAGCTTLTSGSWQTTVDDTIWNTTVSNIKICGQACPESGTLTYAGSESDRSVIITFDGSNRPLFSGTNLTPSTLTLDCTPTN